MPITASDLYSYTSCPHRVYRDAHDDPSPRRPIIGHIPHSSTIIPADERAAFCLSDPELATELLRFTDHHTDQLFAGIVEQGGANLVSNISRLVCDMERFTDDTKEPAAKAGFGAFYQSTGTGETLRKKMTAAKRAALLQKYYFPYHAKLESLAHEALEKFGTCLIIDCHSFPTRPLPYEAHAKEARPDICIGTDAFHTPQELTQKVVAHFEKFGLQVAVNRPLAGSLVPNFYYRRSSSVQSIMLEINRKLYMDEDTGETHAGFKHLQEIIGSLMSELDA